MAARGSDAGIQNLPQREPGIDFATASYTALPEGGGGAKGAWLQPDHGP